MSKAVSANTNEGESADFRAGDIEIGESKLVPKDSLAGYDEWDLRALWNGPSTKTWIEVENAICTSRRKLGGCSGRAYKELEHQISEKGGYTTTNEFDFSVFAGEVETCFSNTGWVVFVSVEELNHNLSSITFRVAKTFIFQVW